MNVREALIKGSADLKSAGIESSSLDASLLLAHVLNTARTALLAKGTDTLNDNVLAAFRALIERRLNGECAAYILGKKEFMEIEFLVNPSVLVPRPETETLVETAINILNKQKKTEPIRVLDLCTGSGAIAVSIKSKLPYVDMYAADICPKALETAKANAARLLPDASIKFFQGDLFNALSVNALNDNALPEEANARRFSLITSNPPYIPTDEIKTLAAEVQNEPRLALDGGHTGLEIIRRIIEDAPDYLLKGGTLLLETAGTKQAEKIAVLLENKCFKNINTYKDLSGQERVIGGVYN